MPRCCRRTFAPLNAAYACLISLPEYARAWRTWCIHAHGHGLTPPLRALLRVRTRCLVVLPRSVRAGSWLFTTCLLIAAVGVSGAAAVVLIVYCWFVATNAMTNALCGFMGSTCCYDKNAFILLGDFVECSLGVLYTVLPAGHTRGLTDDTAARFRCLMMVSVLQVSSATTDIVIMTERVWPAVGRFYAAPLVLERAGVLEDDVVLPRGDVTPR
jgi:hypothetical protein